MIRLFLKLVSLILAVIIILPANASNICLQELWPMERLKCFELQALAEENSKPSDDLIKKNVPITQIEKEPVFHLRESLQELSLDGDPASLAIARSNGETTFKADVAIILDPNKLLAFPGELGKHGWSWRAGIEAHRYTSSVSPINSQSLQFAALGTIPLPLNTNARTTVGLQWTADRITDSKTVGARVNGLVNFLSEDIHMDYGVPHSKNYSARAIFPVFGFHLDRVRNPINSGTLYGGYLGLKARYYPGYALQPLRFFGEILRIRDVGGNGSFPYRSSTLYKFGVNYILSNRSANEFVPSLTLQRTIGSNFLQGIGESVRTDFIFTLSFN